MRYPSCVQAQPNPAPHPSTWDTEIVTGRPAILAHASLLIALTERTGQPGMMDHLHYFLHFQDALKKIPHLILLGPSLQATGPSPATVHAALLIHEYRLLGCGTGIFATDDIGGRRTLIAPAAIRTAAARRAARALMQQGALIVFQSFLETIPDDTALRPWPATPRSAHWRLATQRRLLRAFLPLLDTFDGTLARIGQRTRSNMRYYRRRAEKDLGCTFLPELTPAQLSRFEFRRFNRECTYAVPDAAANARHDAIFTVPGGFVCGIRARRLNGPSGEFRWLALLGGRRHHDTVEIDWQLNRADLPSYSLSTVLRAYLIEHEIARGTRKLFVEGGTPHAMRFSFELQMVRDLLVVRHIPAIRRFNRLLPLLRSYINRRLPKSAFILKILLEPQLAWRSWS